MSELDEATDEQTILIGCACGCVDAMSVAVHPEGFMNSWSGGVPAVMFTIGKHSVIVQGTPLGTLLQMLDAAVARPTPDAEAMERVSVAAIDALETELLSNGAGSDSEATAYSRVLDLYRKAVSR